MEKTLQELYDEVVKDEKLIKEFTAAEKEGKIEEFVKAHGCNATEEELQKFLASEITDEKELSSEELDKVAGGKPGRQIASLIKCEKCDWEKKVSNNVYVAKCPKCGSNVYEKEKYYA